MLISLLSKWVREELKTINVTFEDEEFERLRDYKGDKNWHDFILGLLDSTSTTEKKSNHRKTKHKRREDH